MQKGFLNSCLKLSIEWCREVMKYTFFNFLFRNLTIKPVVENASSS